MTAAANPIATVNAGPAVARMRGHGHLFDRRALQGRARASEPVTKQYALGPFFGRDRHELVSQIPHAAGLGMQVVEAGAAFAILKLPYREELVGDPVRKVVFGGAITTLLDQALGLAVSCSLEDLRPIATLDLRIDYLRPAEPGFDLIGRADCYKVTRNVAFARAVAFEHDIANPFATSLATFMLGSSMADTPFSKALEAYTGKSK